jgi:hypothetical protein
MDERVFDISKPHHHKPDPTGKPVIVGHHPQMPDPMVRGKVPEHPQNTPSIGDSKPFTEPPVPPVSGPDNFMEQPQVDTGPPESKIPDLPPPGTVHEPTATHPPIGQAGPLPGSVSPSSQSAKPADWQPSGELPIPAHHGHHGRRGKKLPLTVLAIVVILMGLYAAIDAGLFLSSENLPFHIFKQDEAVNQQTSPSPTPASSSSTVPTGFAVYKVENTDVSFAYPTAWGLPATTAEPGFSKRGGDNQSDGTYAHLINFASNKDVQVAITSSQFLPASRTALYYDFQRWCKGTADAKIYKQLLHFSSADGVDTPTTVTCDQGPLTDASPLEEQEAVIVQSKTTSPDGSALGDLYTANLSNNDWPVLRVKDSASANAENIKKLLISVKN